MSAIDFSLLSHQVAANAGNKLAWLSVQTKVEKFVLAELAFAAELLLPDFQFRLEERPRRDMTIRLREDGSLVEWVEAKMCYSDCVARRITGGHRPDEYCRLVAEDAAKQRATFLEGKDRGCVLTAALFVFHRKKPHPDHAYYPGFALRKEMGLTPAKIRKEAKRFCIEEVAAAAQRRVEGPVEVELDCETALLAFFYRTPVGVLEPSMDRIDGETSDRRCSTGCASSRKTRSVAGA